MKMQQVTLHRSDFKTEASDGRSYFDWMLSSLNIEDPNEEIDSVTLTITKVEKE